MSIAVPTSNDGLQENKAEFGKKKKYIYMKPQFRIQWSQAFFFNQFSLKKRWKKSKPGLKIFVGNSSEALRTNGFVELDPCNRDLLNPGFAWRNAGRNLNQD